MDTRTQNKPERPHNIVLSDRKRMQVTGVDRVDSFNETAVTLSTSAGLLQVTGKDLSVSSLNVTDGTLVVEGEIYALRYKAPSEKIWKIFK